MNSSGKFYSCSSRNQDENLQSNVEKNQAIIQKQNEQLTKLREYFVNLRNRYHDERRDFAMKSISLQRAIDHTKKKGDQLELRINEIRSSIENAENEKSANDLIQKIWCILKTFRKEVFAEAGEDLPSDNDCPIDNDDDLSNNEILNANYSNQLDPSISKRSAKYNSSAKNTMPKSKSKRSNKNKNTNIPIDSDSGLFDHDQPLPLELDTGPSDNDKCILSSRMNDSIEMTPITSSTTNNTDEIMNTPIIQSNDNYYDSIASRRTRRRCTTNVYYKEPSLKNALTPGDPFTFSIEDGIVTPTIPNNYSRDTPSINTKRRGRKNH